MGIRTKDLMYTSFIEIWSESQQPLKKIGKATIILMYEGKLVEDVVRIVRGMLAATLSIN